jgi:hypothetical protein
LWSTRRPRESRSVNGDAILPLDLLQEPDDLTAGGGLIGEAGVDAVQQYACHGGRRSRTLLELIGEGAGRQALGRHGQHGAGVFGELADFLRFTVIEDLEIGFLQTGHSHSVPARDDIDLHQARSGAENNVRGLRTQRGSQ